MQTKRLCVLRVRLARPETGLSPPVKIFLLTVHFFCGSFMLFMSCFFVMLSCASVC